MSINNYNPHLIILPEDDHNSQIANGFKGDLNVNFRVIQTLRVAGGWKKVLEEFKNTHISSMRQFPQRNMLSLIDFDDQEDRFSYAKDYIPEDLTRISHHDFQKWLISLPDKRSREGQKKQSVILHNQPKVQWGLGLSSFSQDL